MAAFLLAIATLGTSMSVPMEDEATLSLASAQRQMRGGDRGQALATLDGLLLSNGVTVSLERPNAHEHSVAAGLQKWNEALGEDLFRLRPAGESTDITVKFVRKIEEETADTQGFVEATREMSWSSRDHSYRLHGTILVRDNIYGRPIRADEALAVVAHEVGHVLGLADIDREDRLMGPLSPGHVHEGPAEEEVAAMRTYRNSIREAYPKRVDKR